MLEEQALAGFDLELGRRVSFLDDVTDSTRVYGGVYHFAGENTEDVTGWRTRLSSDINQDVQIGARFQKDDVRGSQGFLEATIRFPFGNKQSYKKQGLYARLDESPERDIDIVAKEAVADDGVNELFNNNTGEIQNIIHVDNTAAAGGDGSNEARLNTLAQAQAIAGANDIIYVHRGDGTTAGQNAGITLSQSGQMLIGSGTDFTLDMTRFSFGELAVNPNSVLIAHTAAPMITNSAGDGVTVTGANTYIAGINVSGATGTGVNVTSNGGANLGSIGIKDVTANNNSTWGIYVGSEGLGSSIENLLLENTTTNNNTGFGTRIAALNGGSFTNTSITGAIANNNGAAGIRFEVADAGSRIENSTIENSTASNNLNTGILMRAFGGGQIISSSITGTAANDNLLNGIVNQSNGVGSLIGQSTILNTTTSGNDERGVFVSATVGGVVTSSSITGVTANNNLLQGTYIQSNAAGSVFTESIIENTTTNNNGQQGIHVFATTGAIINESQ